MNTSKNTVHSDSIEVSDMVSSINSKHVSEMFEWICFDHLLLAKLKK
ncbi:MAG: hypothetical protein LBE20_04015 [Deltaproteobacteria bacterium]|jgi:hypothetical protein|nr:hypothetical protein [Deltaproteobacteria bacterium]